MQITFDPTDSDECAKVAEILESIVGEVTPAPAKAATAKKTAAKKTAAKPDPEPEPEEDLIGGGEPTLEDAVARATELVNEGKTPDVKAALAEVGAKRVSDLKGDQISEFLTAVG